MEAISVLIADDHPMVRIGLKNLLENHKDFKNVIEAEDGEDALRKIEQARPTVVIMDISMPKMNGIEATRIITKKYPQTRIIVLTMLEDEAYIGKVIDAGAHGYLLKDAGGEEVIKAVRRVAAGEKYFSNSAFNLIGKRFSKKPKTDLSVDDGALESLTVREKEILMYVADGLSTQEIAKKLFLSPRTVDTHRANIMHKLRLNNAPSLVRFAIDKGLMHKKSP